MNPAPTNSQADSSPQSAPALAPAPTAFRLDPSPSRAFSWLEWLPDAPELLDDATGRCLRPAGPLLRVRFRSTGAEWEHYPVSEAEARRVMNPGAEFDFSIGRAYGSVIRAHKSGRLVRSGERQETVRQRVEVEQRAGRRWMA